MLRVLKSKPHQIVAFYLLDKEEKLQLLTGKDNMIEVIPYGLPISDRQSNGSFVVDIDEEGELEKVFVEAMYEQAFEQTE